MAEMKIALAGAFAGLLLASLAGTWLALADQGKIAGTEHDLGATTIPGISSCETCHVPHDAGGEAIWDGDPRPEGAVSGLAPACYSCHDGTVATGAYVFDADLAQHPVEPGEPGKDCDQCHDPHLSDYGNFLKFASGANLCQVCHGHGSGGNHPLNVDAHQTGIVPTDARFNPGGGDFSGTRLWTASGLQGSHYLKCLTCHTAHGAGADAGLLSMGNGDATGAASSLCQNCHR